MSDRYARQTVLAQVGVEGQAKLQAATVAVVGAGGLGCPVLQYLTGAGVGHLIIVDADVVDISNLHRQPLYATANPGDLKAVAARSVLASLNPDVTVTALTETLTPSNAAGIVGQADVVLDCADSYAATYTLSDTCLALNTPLISASALAMSGYVGGFCAGAPSVRALFPDLPSNLASCATAGVLGPVVGALGAAQAQMALSVLLQLTPSALGELLTLDFANHHFSSFRFDGAPEPRSAHVYPFIALETLRTDDVVIELRGEDEAPLPVIPEAVRATVADFERGGVALPSGGRTVMCCRSGLRAWRAAVALSPCDDKPIVLLAVGDTA
ncbi:MAG: HesA/MoeB/ThiF family protein [Chromatiales bacterium]|jgi:sulfur-carrier protein adenylyltransferase/sulfurtransferase|nr:HesA/MoeB/ThiF family protein [Chromatiales bacterium]